MIKYIFKTPFIIWGFFILLLLGFLIGNDIEHDFVHLYFAKLSQTPIRYSIIVIILAVDNVLFESLNQYIYVVRNKSVYRFLMRTTLYEVIIIVVLLIMLSIPIGFLCFNVFQQFIQTSILFVFATTVMMVLFTAIIRFINIWFNNRVISTSIFIALFAIVDVLVENINWAYFDAPILDFNYIFIFPYVYSNYTVIAMVILSISVILMFMSSIMMDKKDYILRSNQDA
jgi:hypothetical protein